MNHEPKKCEINKGRTRFLVNSSRDEVEDGRRIDDNNYCTTANYTMTDDKKPVGDSNWFNGMGPSGR